MYFITNPTTIMREKYYKEDKKHLLVPTKVPHLFKSYDQARNAIERTATFCRKLRKLNLYGGLDQHNNPTVCRLSHIRKFYKGEAKQKQLDRYRMHQTAKKGDFYGFSPKGLSIVRVALPKAAPTGRVIETEAEIIERGMRALKLSMLNSWVDNTLDREILTRFLRKRTFSAVDKTTIARLYAKYVQRGAGWRGEIDGMPFDLRSQSDASQDVPGADKAEEYSGTIVPDPVLQAAWAASEAKFRNRWRRAWRSAWESYKKLP